ncbi:hypothetical protein FLAN108750_13435 [Flavobacterium antarcticum]|nr:hypothetical protein [Flavobacterium antarcticum]
MNWIKKILRINKQNEKLDVITLLAEKFLDKEKVAIENSEFYDFLE